MTRISIPTFVLLLALCLALPTVAATQAPEIERLVVQDVTCAGNQGYSCEFIREHLYLRAGSTLDEEEIRNAELRLSASRNFDSVAIRLEKGAERGAVIIVIEVDEADPVSTEWLMAGSSRQDSRRGVLAGRLTHQNLFGSGKIADLSGVAIVPLSGEGHNEAYDVTLRYVDPQLFGSRRLFGVAGMSWRKRRFEDGYGNFGELDAGQLEASLGWRFADFSYLSIGATYQPDNDWLFGHWRSDGTFAYQRPESYSDVALTLAYGWSSEDDLHFPTQGSTFQVLLGGEYEPSAPEGRSHLQFRKTWARGGSYWTVKVGGDPSPEYRNSMGESQLFALSYARPVAPGSEILRGRWYIEPGFAIKGYSSQGEDLYEYGVKVGFRADTRRFGYIDLYLLGTKDYRR
jgi:outer membrane protein assembly factor BamA